jgi:predicted nuclease of predicted toxin-antitoxin system
MKLLLDENISYKLVNRLQEFFPGIKHISDFQLNSLMIKSFFSLQKKMILLL